MLIAAVPAQAVAEGSVRSPAAETVGEAPARTSSVIQAQQTVCRGLSHCKVAIATHFATQSDARPAISSAMR